MYSLGLATRDLPILCIGSYRPQSLYDTHSRTYTAEYSVLVVQIRSRCECEEELRPCCSRVSRGTGCI